MTADELEAMMDTAYPRVEPSLRRLCVLTGGEPTLQLDVDLLNVLHQNGWEVAIETNGTTDPIEDGNHVLDFVEHVAVSPKLNADGSLPELGVDIERLYECDVTTEVKIVLPGHVDPSKGWDHRALRALSRNLRWDARYVQPMDPVDPAFVEVSTLKSGAEDKGVHARCVALCLDFVAKNPEWRVGLQTHKFMGLA
jgi:organic radical activating enzyme